jgi:hypothetical protein
MIPELINKLVSITRTSLQLSIALFSIFGKLSAAQTIFVRVQTATLLVSAASAFLLSRRLFTAIFMAIFSACQLLIASFSLHVSSREV